VLHFASDIHCDHALSFSNHFWARQSGMPDLLKAI